MTVFLVIIHVIVCVALIMIVLLQTGKGADIGAAFGGGGSNTLFGTSGASTFLSKATTVAAIVFMITSLTLAYLSSQRPASLGGHGHDAGGGGNESARGKPGRRRGTRCRRNRGQARNPGQAVAGSRYRFLPKWWNLVDTLS